MPEKYPGIRWDAPRKKWKVSVEIGTGTRASRKARSTYYGKDTPPSTMVAWQEATRIELRALLDTDTEVAPVTTPRPAIVTLQDAADLYIPTVAVKHEDSRIGDLKAWLRAKTPTGPLARYALGDITGYHLTLAWNGWRKAGFAESTLNHRRSALLACLRCAAPGMEAMAKTAIPFVVEKLGAPRFLPYPTILRILEAMSPTSVATPFIRVLAETGMGPETLRRLQPDEVDEDARLMTLSSRQKGRGVAGRTLRLAPRAADALRAYRAAGWRSVTNQTIGTVWRHAVTAVRAGAYPRNTPHQSRGTLGPPLRVPECTPYVLRHSFAIRFLDGYKGDPRNIIDALKEYMQHEDLETTLRYLRARTTGAIDVAIDAMAEAAEAYPIAYGTEMNDRAIQTK